jgi:ubiquitin-conjugating enzyme E2 O
MTPVDEAAATAADSANHEENPVDTSLSLAADEVSAPTKIVPLSPGSFVTVAESVPAGHKFKLTVFQPANMRSFVASVRKELRLLQSSLPPGITVKGYEERMDLYSAMIEGPKNTPYEDGLFFFDFQLGKQ